MLSRQDSSQKSTRTPRTPLDIPFIVAATAIWLLSLGQSELWSEAKQGAALAGGFLLLFTRQVFLGYFHPYLPMDKKNRAWTWALYAICVLLLLSASSLTRQKVIHAGSDYRVPFQLPGPEDKWSEGMAREITVPTSGTRGALLILSLHESHDTAPPMILVTAGECEVAKFRVVPGNGAKFPHWKHGGLASSYEVRVPRQCLTPDKNEVVFHPITGSWIVINNVKVIELPYPWEPWRHVPRPWSWILFWLSLGVIALRGAIGSPRPKRQLAMYGMMLLLILAMIAAAFVAMAVYVETRNRWMVTDPTNFRSPQMFYGSKFIHNADQGWTMLPGFVGKTLSSGVADPVVFYKVNRHGYRSLEYEDDFPPSGKVMLLGDSFAQGAFLAQEETIPAVLSRRLGEYVFNFGVGGYSTDQEYTTFMKWVDRAPSEWVVLLFFANDILYNDSDLGHNFQKPRYAIDASGQVDFSTLIPVDPEYVKEENDFVYLKIEMEKTFCCLIKKEVSIAGRISHKAFQYIGHIHDPGMLLSYIIADIAKTKAQPGPKHLDVTAEIQENPEKYIRQFHISFQFLDRIRDESHKRKRKFLVVYIPDIKQIYERSKPELANFKNMFMRLCEENGIDCLDPSEQLARRARWNDTYFIDDGHLSPFGAQIVGDMIADYIQAK